MSTNKPNQTYDVFISYSRKDSEFAKILREELESFNPPKALGLPMRHLKIFLDQSDFTGPNYDSAIQTHLKNSDKLAVICSPNARNSTFNERLGIRYVDHEIECFNNFHGDPEKNIILIHLSGIANNEATPDQESEKSYPESLNKLFQMPTGIKFVGFRPKTSKITRGEFEDAWYQLLSGVYRNFDKTPSEIQQKELKRQKHKWKVYSIIATTLSGMLVIAFVIAWKSYQKAEHEKHQSQARELTLQAQQERSKSIDRALLLGLQALKMTVPDPPIPQAKVFMFSLIKDFQHLTKIGWGHGSSMQAVAYNSKNKQFATSGLDGVLQLWDAGGYQIGNPIQADPAMIWTVAFSPDGKKIATAGVSGQIRIWDSETLLPIGSPLIGHYKTVFDVAFSPNGMTIASAGRDRTVRVWDLNNGQSLGNPLEGHTKGVTAVTFSPNGEHLISASEDSTVRIWDTKNWTPVGKPWFGHKGPISDVAISPDGTIVATCGHDKTIRLWNIASGQEIGKPLIGHTDSVKRVVFSPDNGKLLISASNDRSIRVWDPISIQQIGEPLWGHENAIWAIAFLGNKDHLVSASLDKTIRIWDLSNKNTIASKWQADRPVLNVSFNDEKLLRSVDSVGRLTEWSEGNLHFLGSKVLIPAENVVINKVAWNLEKTQIAMAVAGETQGAIGVWNSLNGQSASVIKNTDQIFGLALSPDGRYIVSGGMMGEVRLWDLHSTNPLTERFLSKTKEEFEFLHNLRLQAEQGKQLGIFSSDGIEPNSVFSISFSDNGHWLAAGANNGSVKVWDMSNDEHRFRTQLRGHSDAISALDFSSDGKYLATGSEDKSIRLWDILSENSVETPIYGHENGVVALAFSPDNKMLASASRDRSVRLWDVPSGKAIGGIKEAHADWVTDVTFSNDGKTIASSGKDGSIGIWDIEALTGSTSFWEKRACEMANRNLTLAEWKNALGDTESQNYSKTCPDLPCPTDLIETAEGLCIEKSKIDK